MCSKDYQNRKQSLLMNWPRKAKKESTESHNLKGLSNHLLKN